MNERYKKINKLIYLGIIIGIFFMLLGIIIWSVNLYKEIQMNHKGVDSARMEIKYNKYRLERLVHTDSMYERVIRKSIYDDSMKIALLKENHNLLIKLNNKLK